VEFENQIVRICWHLFICLECSILLHLETIRQEFPVVDSITYLNHAACAPISTRVRTAMESLLKDHNENAALNHGAWDTRIRQVRERTAAFISAQPEEIAFVKNTSEGISFVASGFPWQSGDNVVINTLEFPANVFPWLNLKHLGVETRFVEDRDGRILTDDIRAAMDDRTRVVAMSHIQFGNGYRCDIESVGTLCRQRDVFFVVDAIQSLGHIKVDLTETPVDILTGATYKWLMGPEGGGILYCSPAIMERLQLHEIGCNAMAEAGVYDTFEFELAPDARRFECGTPNTVGIYGLGAALELLMDVGSEAIEEQLRILSATLIEGLERKGYRILSHRSDTEWSGIVTFVSDRYPAEALHQILRDHKIIEALRFGGIRVSAHFYNTEEEVLRVVDVLPDHG